MRARGDSRELVPPRAKGCADSRELVPPRAKGMCGLAGARPSKGERESRREDHLAVAGTEKGKGYILSTL